MDIHRQKLQEMRSQVNATQTLYQKINKSKTDQMQEDRFTEIERENRILFEKISRIKLKYPQTNTNQQNQFENSLILGMGGFSNKRNSPLGRAEINQRKRERDQNKIFQENMKFLERLRKSKATVDSSHLEGFEKQQQTYLKNLVSGPLQFNSQRTNSVVKQHPGLVAQKESLKNTQLNLSYRKPKHLSNSHYTNKDFTSGLRLPRASNNQQDLFQVLKYSNDDNHYGGNSDGGGSGSGLGDSQDQISEIGGNMLGRVPRKRFRTKPRQRKQNNSLVQSNQAISTFGQEQVLYKTKIAVDQIGTVLNIQIVKIDKKVYIRSQNPQIKNGEQEIEIYLKQLTHYLMSFNNDFELFVNECLYQKQGKLLLKDLNKQRYCSIQQTIPIGLDTQNSQIPQIQYVSQNQQIQKTQPQQQISQLRASKPEAKSQLDLIDKDNKINQQSDFSFQHNDPKISSANQSPNTIRDPL